MTAGDGCKLGSNCLVRVMSVAEGSVGVECVGEV